MKNLELTRYWTMNPWNKLSSIAYNLKIYNVIDRDLQGKAFELLECHSFHDDISILISNFTYENKGYTAGFNGKSGGYLVLYPDKGNHLDDDIPEDVKTNFEQLAKDIVSHTEYLAANADIETVTYHEPKEYKTYTIKGN